MKIDKQPLSKREFKDIKQGLKDIKEGRVYTLEEIKRKYGLK